MNLEQLQEAYPPGSTVDCVVTRVEPFGVFVRLKGAPRVFGFIRPRDWSWSRRVFDLSEQVRPGFACEAQVLGHGPRRKLELSRRLTLPDPFPGFLDKHKPGDVVLGQVTLVAQGETGVVVALEDGVEGFIPRSEIPHVGEEGFGLLVQDWVAARILGFQKDQVRLSIKEHLADRARRAAAGDDSQTALRFHPDLGPGLEDMRLNLALAEVDEPDIDPAVRERIRRVLLVEDSANVSESLEMIFEHFGFPCDAAGTIDEALALLGGSDYDLLILDVNMPAGGEASSAGDGATRSPLGDGGLELIRRLKDEATDAIVFVLTATAAADWAEILRHQPNARTCFFQKPTRVARLFEQLALLVHGGEPADDRHLGAGLDPRGSPELSSRRGSGFVHKIREALDELRLATGASHAFVLALRPGPHFSLVAGELPAELGREVQQELEMSPVGDVIRQRRFLAVPDVAAQQRRFKHLLAVHPHGSFAGVALAYSDQSEYGLFLTGAEPGQLRGATEERLATTALVVGHYVAEQRLDQVITENQALLLTGFLSDSLLHEIKNELQALADYTAVQVLLGKKNKDDLTALSKNETLELKRSILGVRAVSKRLDELVVLFRNLAGRQRRETVDLNASVERLRETVKPFADGYNVAVETDLDGSVPVLSASPKLIDQALLNLMINSIEQMATSGAAHRVLTVTTRWRDGAELPVEVMIADTGRGVHWVHREKIFDLFFTTKTRGTGLGLYISRFFIEQLGGRLTLRRSVLFSGAEFAVELPREAVA
jgi:signal transduction histidine kinase/predicted RNA-binding protein with RPS1 domain